MMQDISAQSITVISVCHNSTAVLPAMLGSLPEGVPIILVDNGSQDIENLSKMADARGIRLIVNAENRGFGIACNQGAAEVHTEFLFFLNPDAAVESDALEALVAAARRYPDAVAMNPAIRTGNGDRYFKRSSVLLPRCKWMARGWPEADCVVPVLNGAALFVRRVAFEAVGGFDPAIFLYHEDDDLSLRLRASAGKLMFIREAVVRHLQGLSTASCLEVRAFKGWHLGRSRVYAARKHGRFLAFTSALGEALLQVASPMMLFSAHKRAKHLAFLRGVWSARTLSRSQRVD